MFYTAMSIRFWFSVRSTSELTVKRVTKALYHTTYDTWLCASRQPTSCVDASTDRPAILRVHLRSATATASKF